MDFPLELSMIIGKLQSKKVKQRKEGIEQITTWLKNKDSDSLDNHKQWNNLFLVIKGLILEEIDIIVKTDIPCSQVAKNNRDKRLEDMKSLLKLFLKQSYKLNVTLKTKDLMNHIVEVLDCRDRVSLMGMAYCDILRECVLSIYENQIKITAEHYDLLLRKTVEWILRSPFVSFDRGQLANLAFKLASNSSRIYELNWSKLSNLVLQYFSIDNIQGENSGSVCSYMLSTLTVILSCLATSNRTQMCRIGESLMPCIFTISRKFNQCKNSVIDFIQLQVIAHHPYDAYTKEEGAYMYDDKFWLKHLGLIYEFLMTESSDALKKSKYNSGKKDLVQYLDLLSSVYTQLIFDRSDSCDIDTPPSGKKIKLQFTWYTLVNVIKNKGNNNEEIILWLNILHRILKKVKHVPDDVATCLFHSLRDLVNSTKDEVTIRHIYLSLKELYHYDKNFDWSSVGNFALQTFLAQKAQKESVLLLNTLKEKNFKIFYDKATKVNANSLLFLDNMLENMQPENRSLILSWVFEVKMYLNTFQCSHYVHTLGSIILRLVVINAEGLSLSKLLNEQKQDTLVDIQELYKIYFSGPNLNNFFNFGTPTTFDREKKKKRLTAEYKIFLDWLMHVSLFLDDQNIFYNINIFNLTVVVYMHLFIWNIINFDTIENQNILLVVRKSFSNILHQFTKEDDLIGIEQLIQLPPQSPVDIKEFYSHLLDDGNIDVALRDILRSFLKKGIILEHKNIESVLDENILEEKSTRLLELFKFCCCLSTTNNFSLTREFIFDCVRKLPVTIANFHLIQTFISYFSKTYQNLSDNEVEDLQSILKGTFRALNNSTEVNCALIKLMEPLPGQVQSADEMEVYYKLIQVCWGLSEDRSHKLIMRGSLIEVLIKFYEVGFKRREITKLLILKIAEEDLNNCLKLIRRIPNFFLDCDDSSFLRFQSFEIQRELIDVSKESYINQFENHHLEYSANDETDSQRNLSVSFLLYLTGILISNSACTADALFLLCKCISNHKLNMVKAQNLLAEVASYLKLKSVKDLFELHMPVIIYKWLKNGTSVAEFPLILNISQQQFIKEYKKYGRPFEYIREGNFPRDGSDNILLDIFVYTLLMNDRSAINKFERTIEKRKIVEIIKRNQSFVTLTFITCVHIYDENFPHRSISQVNDAFDRLNVYLNMDQGLISFLTESDIVSIYMELSTRLSKSYTSTLKRNTLSSYHLFFQLLTNSGLVNRSYWEFVFRHNLLTLVSVLRLIDIKWFGKRKCESELFIFVLKFLEELVLYSLNSNYNGLGRYINDIVNELKEVISKDDLTGSDVRKTALSVLENIIVHEQMKQYEDKFDPFPSRSCYDNILNIINKRQKTNAIISIPEKFKTFLVKSNNHEQIHSLLDFIQRKREEIINLFSKDDTFKELLSQTYVKLIHLIRTSEYEEAAKCLSILGPLNIGSFFKSRDTKDEVASQENIYKDLWIILQQYLQDYDLNTCIIATKTCSFLFSQFPNFRTHIEKTSNEYDRRIIFCFRDYGSKYLSKDFQKDFKHSDQKIDYSNEFSEWTLKLSLKMSQNDQFLSFFAQLLVESETLRLKILPYLLHNVFSNYKDKKNLEECHTILRESLKSPIDHLSKAKCVLDMFSYVTAQNYLENVQEDFACLNIDYKLLAETAYKCGMFMDAIRYLEIWYNLNNRIINGNEEQDFFCNRNISQSLSDTSTEKLLLNCFLALKDDNAIYAFRNTSSLEARVHSFEKDGNFHRSLVLYDSVSPNNSYYIAETLNKMCLPSVLRDYLRQTIDDSNEKLRSLQMESAWKCGLWEEIPNEKSDNFHWNLAQALKNVKDKVSRTEYLQSALNVTLDEFKHNSVEHCCVPYEFLSRLHCLHLIEQGENPFIYEKSFTKSSFEVLESIYSVRRILSNDLESVLQIAKLSERFRRFDFAEMHLQKALQGTLKNSDAFQLRLRQAKIWWAKGEREMACDKIEGIINDLGKEDLTPSIQFLTAKSLLAAAKWLAETRTEMSSVIIDQYLKKAASIMESHGDVKGKKQAYQTLAEFADDHFVELHEYTRSPAFEMKKILLHQANESLQTHLADTSSRFKRVLNKQRELDTNEIERQNAEKKKTLLLALKNYAESLRLGTDKDLKIFRFVSLWFDTLEQDDVTKQVCCYLSSFEIC